MTYVLDASVALKWVLPETDADRARRLRDAAQRQVLDLIAPDSFALECAHSLTKKERQGLVTDARALWIDLMLDAPVLFPSLPLMDRALILASHARIAVYDRLYVALAERQGCAVVTADARPAHSLPASPIVLLAALP